jgi:hypothetical protein
MELFWHLKLFHIRPFFVGGLGVELAKKKGKKNPLSNPKISM